MTAPHDHLDPARDLDALADVLAGEAPAPDCATCAAVVEELEAAGARVSAALASLDAPTVPDELAARLDAALRDAAAVDASVDAAPSALASVTTLPVADDATDRAAREVRGPRRWLPAAAAAAVLVGGGVLAAQTLSLPGSSNDETASALSGATDAGGRDLVRNDSGNAYTPANLAGAVPGLLTGAVPRFPGPPVTADAELTTTATERSTGGGTSGGTGGGGSPGATPRTQAVQPSPMTADPLAALRTTPGLAGCLAALLPPDDDSVAPLALDYGTFDGQPALLVLLPVPERADKVDVFVVGAGCAQADEQLLFFQRVDRPS